MTIKVLVAGKFDIVHPGHLKFFEEAKKLGDYLTVVVARDSIIIKNKGYGPTYSENQRKEFLEALTVVDKVVLGSEEFELNILKEIKLDVLCLGYDQKISEEVISKYLFENNLQLKVVRLTAFREDLFKSSKIKSQVTRSKEKVAEEYEHTPVKNKDALDEVPVIVGNYDEIEDWSMDPKGYFLIRVNKERSILELAHCKQLGIIDCIFEGKKPQDIYYELHKKKLISRVDHAAYIGKELHKAYVCLKKEKEYVQDEEFEI
ncbi:hypothetical protein CL619_04285 [archaeon]|nr:hypothetical protein [archaeon]|tara:strand:- start:1759 stop:2541 length:783 start_codon:yes stop_codon:yes gene_type:complete